MKRKKTLLQAKLEHRILHGLLCEWETARWVLSSAHKKMLTKPLFSLKKMQNLGYWSRPKREICLNRQFVLNHPWDAVREVLLH